VTATKFHFLPASPLTLAALCAALVSVPASVLPGASLGGVVVRFEAYQGQATLNARSVEPFKIQIAVDRRAETKPLVLRIELPRTGRNAWPANDVEVRAAAGKALPVRRSGIEWATLLVPLPAGVTNCTVQAVAPPGGWPRPTAEKDRIIADEASGFHLRVARWPDGRAAALSLRFDDSHPTHLSKVVPILREYGFRGTFMINPGASEPGSRRISSFQEQRAEWEALAVQGHHELANHSAHHRGAVGDEDMEREIGEAAEAIWKLTPGRSRLMALNLGGGTIWETTRTLRYYLDKYHQFDASSGSLGMDDTYGNRVAAFRTMLEQHIERGLWCRIHYHYIGDGLSSTEENFRAALDVARQHESRLWIAGMADIHKYQTERDAAKLAVQKSAPGRLAFRLSGLADPALYDQPLTLEITRAPSLNATRLQVKDTHGNVVALRAGQTDGVSVLRFELPPKNAEYSIETKP
jgi:peptidoglycan/xylan/chitin deacetylase (PgdA/CDA1 family)